MRSYGLSLVKWVEESIRIGRESGASVQISHLAAAGRASWGRVNVALAAIEAANAEGVAVTADQYPYLAGSGPITPLLPGWAQEGGPASIVARLRDPVQRARVRDEVYIDVGMAEVPGPNPRPADMLIVSSPHDPSMQGRTLQRVADERRMDPRDAYFDLLIGSECQARASVFTKCEDDVRTVMRHPLVMVGSDSQSMVIGGRSADQHPHPRTYGTFARILGHYMRDEGVLTLEDAVASMTSRPAAKLNLADRGTVAVGQRADLVLFSAERICDVSTFEDPHHYAEGIEMVMVNGRIVVDGARHTDALAGRVLRLN
jgi:N-acyl-D-aspartate/D-glutamate deacylase